VFVVLAATLLVSMAIAAAVNSPILRDKAGQNSTDWFENIAQRVTQTLETSVPSDTIECDNSTITNELEVPVPHRHTGAHIRQRDKQTQPDAKPLKTGNDTELDYENIALQYVSKTHGIPVEELTVSHKVQPHYWVIDKKMWCMKIDMKKWNLNKGPLPMFDEVCVDLDGNIVNESEFREQDKKAYREKYGKLEPDLYYRLQSMQPNETIKVIIDLVGVDTKAIEREVLSKYPNIEIIENLTESFSITRDPNRDVIGHIPVFLKDGKLSREERLKIRDEFYVAKREAYAQKEKPLLDYLTAKGYDARGAKGVPTVFATLPKEEIIALQERDDVAKIWLSLSGGPEIDTAVPTIRADKAWSACGYDEDFASWSRIAIVDDEGVDFANPYLHGYMRPGQWDIDGHPTECAGVAASTHPTFRGVAYNATILSAPSGSWWDEDIEDAAEWAIAEGAGVLSCSFWIGTNLTMKWIDRYFDKVVYEDRCSVVKSAGNRGLTDGNVTSPGLGWNVITVGGIDDGDNPYWYDDDIWQNSSYKDPESPHHDRNKPEVCAVSRWIRSTETQEYFNENGMWITNSSWRYAGTSYAAPAVAGIIAMLDTCSLSCFMYPQVYKAVILASATHNVYGDPIDDKEGVGTVDASKAWEIVNNEFIDSDFVIPHASRLIYFDAVKGEKVRFVISWCSHTNWDVDESYDVLETDFDLYIYDPQGNLVDKSRSHDNNYEVVDFTAPVSGQYEALIARIEGDEEEYVGCAWSRYSVESDFWCPLKVAVHEPFQFFKMSGGDTTYAWDFDNDGEIDSYEENPEHSYEQAGLYTVSLTVTDSGGTCKETKYDCIRAGPVADAARPLIDADFYATPRVGTPPLTVKFTDTSSGGEINSWKWDFGDGNVSYEQNPTHTYYDVGAYDVSLEVTNTNGARTKETKFDYVKPGYDITIYVDTGGWWYAGGQYNPSDTPIQDAVDHAGAGYEIIVHPGTYTENVYIAGGGRLTIRSLSGNPEDTIVQAANPDWAVFWVHRPYVTVSGLTVTGATGWAGAGILLDSSADNCIISNNIITNNGFVGIWVDAPSNVTITDNEVSDNNDMGIFIDCGGSGHTIANNSVSNNGDIGIDLYHSWGGELINNSVTNNEKGIFIGDNIENWNIMENTVCENAYGISAYDAPYSNYLTNNVVCCNKRFDIYVGSGVLFGDDNTCHLGYGYCDDSAWCPPACAYLCPGTPEVDLWIRDAFLDTWVVPGVNYTVTYTVWNIGYEMAGASTTGIIINGVRTYDDPVPALDPFESYTNTVGPFDLTNPPAPDRIEVCADIDNEVYEDGSEDNNCRENHFGGPDLVITDAHGEWVDPSWKTYNVTYTVKNIGDVTSNASETKIILEDAEHSEICNVTVSVPELEVGESYTDTVGPFTMP